MRRLLVTGFGPFPRMPRNPSGEAARAIAASPRLRLHGIEARAAVLTTAYATLPGELDPLLATSPGAVLMIGVAGRASRVRIETRATSRRSILFPDVLRDIPTRRQPRRAEAARRTAVNAAEALARMRSRKVPARLSRDAGRYLCNAAYFHALVGVAPTLFIHIPKVPGSRPMHGRGARLVGRRWRAALTAALVDIAIGMLPRARTAEPPSAVSTALVRRCREKVLLGGRWPRGGREPASTHLTCVAPASRLD